MPKIISPIIIAFICALLYISPVFAASFDLTYIGGLNTSGKRYNHWWYTGTNPTLTGQANPGATVTVTINNNAQTITADSLGNWTYPSTTLTPGDHSVNLTSDGQYIVFTLTIGSTLPDTFDTTPSSPTTPSRVRTATSSGTLLTAGSADTLILISGFGLLMVAGGLSLKKFYKLA